MPAAGDAGMGKWRYSHAVFILHGCRLHGEIMPCRTSQASSVTWMTRTMKTTRLASQTTTAGCPSNAKADLASLILQAANQSAARRTLGWQSSLTPEQLAVVDSVKRGWLATRKETGISAVHLARTIIAQMPECQFPRPKSLAEWLTSARQ